MGDGLADEPDADGIHCTCGHKLIDHIDPPEVTVEGETFQFRRTTDFIVCDGCGTMYRVTELEHEPWIRLVAQELSDLSREE